MKDLSSKDLRLNKMPSNSGGSLKTPKNRRGVGGNSVVPELKLVKSQSTASGGKLARKSSLFPSIKGATPAPK